MMGKWHNINWLLVASLATLAYALIVLRWIGLDRILIYPTNSSLNEVGDFIAGFFAPLAVIWLICAVFTQRQELVDTRDQFKKNQEAINAQMAEIREQSAFLLKQHTLTEDTAKRTYRLSLFERRFAIYLEIIELQSQMVQRGIVGDFHLQLFSLSEKASFVFGKKTYEYLRESYIQCLELHDFIGRHREAFENQPSYTVRLSSDPAKMELINKAESIKAHITGLLEQKTLRNVMWDELHVSDT